MEPEHASILQRLASGETLEAVLSSLRPAGEREALRRCAVVRTFDRKLYEEVLVPEDVDAGWPPFDDFVQVAEVEPVPRREGVYWLRPGDRSAGWKAWWPDGEPALAETELPGPLRVLVSRLADHYAKMKRPLDQLAHLALADREAAAELFSKQYEAADERFDLASCQDFVDVLSDAERGPYFGARLTELCKDRAAYLQARSLWSAEYLRSATFLEPPGTREVYARLLAGRGPRVLYLHAQGGRGKTMELRWLIARQLVPERRPDDGRFGEGRVPCVKLDFDFLDPVNATRDPWLVLLEAAAQLNQQLPEGAFNEFLEQYGWAAPLLQRQRADSSRVAAASKRLAGQRDRLAGTVPRRFAEQLAAAAGTKPVLIVFDTLEEVHLRPQADLRALLGLLGTLLARCETLCMIVAGRYDLGEILGPTVRELPPMLERHLGQFSPGDAERYLAELRHVGGVSVRQAIVAKADGDPFRLSLLADIAEQSRRITPAQIKHYDADLIYLILRVISRIENPRVRWLLRYGVAPRTVTLDFVRDVMQRYLRKVMSGDLTLDSPQADRLPQELEGSSAFPVDVLTSRRAPLDLEALFAELSRYSGSTSWVSMVPGEPETLRFHLNVVAPMRRLMGERQVFKRIHRDAVRYYERKAAQDPARWRRWTSEAIYHHFQLEGSTAVRYWRAALDAVQLGDAEQRAALAAELLGGDYVDEGEPLPWVDGTCIVTPETLLEARFERASALTQMARTGKVSANDQLWSQAEQNLAEIERGHAKLGRPVIPAWRLAYVRAALAVRDGDVAGAETLLQDALPQAGHGQDVVRLRLLLADVQLARRDRAAIQACQAALRSARKLPSDRRWEPFIRTRLVAAYTEFDQLREARNESRKALEPAALSADQRAELMLADAEACLRSGYLAAAASTAREAYGLTGDWRARALSVRAARASRQAIRALGLAGIPDAANPGEAIVTTLSAETASGFELSGLAAGAVMEFGRAFAAFDVAQTIWYDQGELEGAARCYVHAATLQMRDVGNLKVAEHQLLAAEALEIASGGDGWLQRSLACVELHDRLGQRAEAAERARATLDVLRTGNAPPRQLVQAAVGALAVCPPDQQAGLLALVEDQLGLVSPPAARVVLLRDLSRVGALGGTGARERLVQIRRLLRISGDKQLTASDRALLTMTLAEVDRLAGNRPAARTKLYAAAAVLRRPGQRFYLREWSLAMDRLGPRPSFTDPAYWEIKAFLQEYSDYPALCGAFLVERAEPLLTVSTKKAEQLIAQAESLLGASPEPETQWRALLYRTRAALADQNSETNAWGRYRRLAGAAFNLLGDFIRARVSPESAGDRALAELEASRVRVRLALDGESRDLTVSTWITPGNHVTRLYPGESPVVGLLRRDTASDPGLLEFSYEFADRFSRDWLQLGEQLGTLLFPAETADATGNPARPRSDIRLETASRQLAAIPWELARHPGTGRPVAEIGAPDVTVYRATSREEAGRDEIQFVQAALNQLHGADLPVDGDYGLVTSRALSRYQERQQMAADGVVRPEILARLQEDLAARRDDPAERPRVVLVQPSDSRQLQGRRGKATLGLDLRRLYRLHGFDVVVVENPTLDRLAFVLASTASNSWPPVIVHLSGGLREARGGVAWTFASGEWGAAALTGSRSSDEIPVSSLDRMLSVFPRDLSRPLVILDADRPASETESIFSLLLRNAYAAELFALGGCSAVLATGLVTEARVPGREVYEPMVRLLAESHPIGATCARLRNRATSPGLDEALPLAGIALFTHMPWLRPGLARPGGDDERS